MIDSSYYRIVRSVFQSVLLLVLLVAIAVLRVGCENVTMKSRSMGNGMMTTETSGTTAVKRVTEVSVCCMPYSSIKRMEELMHVKYLGTYASRKVRRQ